MNEQKIIKISTPTGGKPFIRQLPSFNPIWGNCRFFINEKILECDLWVVYGGLQEKESTLCPAGGTLLITAEPPSVKKYGKKFLRQFSTVLTCQENMRHPNLILRQQALPWWVGHKFNKKIDDGKYEKTYDELKSINSIKKTKVLSVIVSNKNFTKGHRERLDFLKKLQESFGNNIDIFGVGFNEINDKWDAIAPYKYHIAIENSSLENYWTEKLSDAFLGMSYPIYYGCSNIYNYFSGDSLSVIDIAKSSEAIDKIRSIIESGAYEKSKGAILKSRDLVLDEYQLFPMLAKYASSHKSEDKKILITINPETENHIIPILRSLLKLFRKSL